MQKNFEVSGQGSYALHLLQRLVNALGQKDLRSILESKEIAAFMREAQERKRRGKLTDDRPGSKLPGQLDPKDLLRDMQFGNIGLDKTPDGLGGFDLIDVLQELFHSIGSHLGEFDHGSGGGDPATSPNDPNTHITRTADGFHINTTHADRSQDGMSWHNNGNWTVEHITSDGTIRSTSSTHDAGGGFTITDTTTSRTGGTIDIHVQHYDSHGNPISPGEDGAGDSNSDNNPLAFINILAVASIEQIGRMYEHPIADSEKLDPNSDKNPIERSGSMEGGNSGVVPKPEELDPNDDSNPLSGLKIDPNQLSSTSHNEDDLDPNTGLKPRPGGGGG